MKAGKLLRNFLAVLIDHKRIGQLGEIAEQFRRELDDRMGIAQARVSSARALTPADLTLSERPRLFTSIKANCQTHTGITEGTFFRDQGWYFYQLGRYIERADQTTRLLDVKFHRLAAAAASASRARCSAISRAASAARAALRSAVRASRASMTALRAARRSSASGLSGAGPSWHRCSAAFRASIVDARIISRM